MFTYLSESEISEKYRSLVQRYALSCSSSCHAEYFEVPVVNYQAFCQALRDEHGFEMLVDLIGVDYLSWPGDRPFVKRFGVTVLLLSVSRNQRIAVRVYAEDDDFPVLPSLCSLWSSANWYEREAFDLYGISFDGHPDLRRILTDYGFIGFPFRKDFPVSGYAEVRYDPDLGRVVYQPVTIEPREIVQRVIREPGYAEGISD